MSKYKVMIVDDHTIFRNGMKQLLTKLDYVDFVGEASNGKEFLEKLNDTVDLVFIDINMPILDGFGAVLSSLEQYPYLKIIVL